GPTTPASCVTGAAAGESGALGEEGSPARPPGESNASPAGTAPAAPARPAPRIGPAGESASADAAPGNDCSTPGPTTLANCAASIHRLPGLDRSAVAMATSAYAAANKPDVIPIIRAHRFFARDIEFHPFLSETSSSGSDGSAPKN